MEFKNKVLAPDKPRCQLVREGCDLLKVEARQNLLRRHGEEAFKTVVLTEGFLDYLPEESVVSLAKDLFNEESFHSWIMDINDPALTQWFQSQFVPELVPGQGTPLPFVPANRSEFFRPYGWNPGILYSIYAEGERLNRLPPENWTGALKEAIAKSGVTLLTKQGPS